MTFRNLGGGRLMFERLLRLFVQARVLERRRHGRRNGRQQPHVGFAECIFALKVLDPDATDAAVAADHRHQHVRQAGVGAGHQAGGQALGQRVLDQRLTPPEHPRPALVRIEDRFNGIQAHAMLEHVARADCAPRVIDPADRDVAGLQHVAQLIADEIDDGLEFELRGHALLDAVDHRQLGSAGCGLLRTGQCTRGLRSERGQHVALWCLEAAEGAVDVGVEEAEHAPLHDQRCHDARALRGAGCTDGAVAQARLARGVGLGEPGCDRVQQRGGIFASGQQARLDATWRCRPAPAKAGALRSPVPPRAAAGRASGSRFAVRSRAAPKLRACHSLRGESAACHCPLTSSSCGPNCDL